MQFGQPFGGLFPGVLGSVLAVLLRTGKPLTGRQVHSLVGGDHGLWSVQQALAHLEQLGIVEITVAGRAHLHSINERHYAVEPLRGLMDPFGVLRRVVAEEAGDGVQAVLVFGSVARGEAKPGSDVDLAVIAEPGWNRRGELEDAVQTRIGNACDVLVFTPREFAELARSGDEPVVKEILDDGIAIVGQVDAVMGTVA